MQFLTPLTNHTPSSSVLPYATMSTAPANESQWFRLPAQVRPSHYDITMLSDLERLTFQGAVEVSLDVLEDTRTLAFNIGKGLTLSQVLVTSPTFSELLTPNVSMQHERVTVSLPANVSQGTQVTLLAGYQGTIDQSMMGYYQSTWEHKGRKGNYALTQFEPTSARRAFPCWDEPELKATYRLRMLHRQDTTALGNMPSVNTQPVDAAQAAEALRVKQLA